MGGSAGAGEGPPPPKGEGRAAQAPTPARRLGLSGTAAWPATRSSGQDNYRVGNTSAVLYLYSPGPVLLVGYRYRKMVPAVLREVRRKHGGPYKCRELTAQ